MAGPLRTYAFINAKLRTRISKILSDELMNQMIRVRTLPEAMHLLRETPFALIETVYNKTGDLKMGELELFKKEVDLYTELERYLHGNILNFVRALSTRFEIDNLKTALRLWFDRTIRRRSIEEAVGYLYRDQIHYNLHVDSIIYAQSIEDVIAALQGTPYAQILINNTERIREAGSIFPIEIDLDHYFYRQLINETESLESRDCEITQRMIGVEIDMQNINWLIRFKNFYNLSLEESIQYMIPEGYSIDRDAISSAYSSQNITGILSGLVKKKYSGLSTMLTAQSSEGYSRLILIERILQQIMMYEVRHVLAGYPFTIGIILAYFILKQNEIKKIMTVLNAKYYQIPEERIKSVL